MTASQHPLDLVPGSALGPFRLGSLLFNVLNHVREYRDTYPHANLAWDEQNPLSSPVHLSLTTPPLHLTFSPPAQRLSRIQVTGPNPGSHVAYRQQRLQSTANTAAAENDDEDEEEREDVVKRIRTILGPTFGSSKAPTVAKGSTEQDHDEEENMLCYPGVAFGVQKTRSGSTRLKRIVLTPLPIPKGIPIDQAWRHLQTVDNRGVDSFTVAQGDLHRAVIELDPDNLAADKPRVTLRFHSRSAAAAGAVSPPHEDGAPVVVVLEIGETTSEDILCELGSAVRTFWKEDDRLAIHTAAAVGAPSSSFSSASKAALEPNPYFLSYPHLGLTLLISPSSHLLEKVILHSNTPGQVQFGRTARALWTIVRRRRRQRSPAPTAATTSVDADAELGGEVGVGVECGFEAVREYLRGGGEGGGAGEDERPIELDRTAFLSSAGGGPMHSTTGHGSGSEGAQQQQTDSGIRGPSTEIYGFSSGVACEVTQSGDVETLWLF
ncbi:hypothetical protein JCM8115_003762 [Rhodotorula mucilaginosa]